MKKYIFTIGILIFTINKINSQINSPTALSATITGSHAFFDASDYGVNWASNVSKGMVFPQTDLTNWIFKTDVLEEGLIFTTAYDGMIVYNTGTGSTKVTSPFGGILPLQKADNGAVTSVAPGFYYFYNPIRYDTQLIPQPLPADTVEFGKWIPISNSGSGVSTIPIKDIVETTPINTGVAIAGETIWAVKGSFSIPYAPTLLVPNPTYVSTAVVSIPKPTDFKGYTKMTTYIDGKTFRSDVSSLTIDLVTPTNINVVTGNGLFSEVYPGGNYTYTLEFFKL